MPMRIPSTLLKSAALLLLSASFLAGSKASAVTVFDWTSDVSGISGTGQFTINENIGDLLPGNSYEITSISGTFNGATIGALLPADPAAGSYNGNNNLYYYNTSNFFALDISGVSFDADGGLVNYNLYGNSGASADSFSSSAGPGGTFTSSASVPGPLPILGIPAVLFYTRKLKNRIKASRETSKASLT
jgi:hypothetical protein